jgi:hypothetical protein
MREAGLASNGKGSISRASALKEQNMKRLPTLSEVEAVLGPSKEWSGRCYEIASACVNRGLVEGVAVYGHWRGKIHPESVFAEKGRLGFVKHGWVLLEDGTIFDPTQWVFTKKKPFLYHGSSTDYDEGGNLLRKETRRQPPDFDPEEDIFKIDDGKLSSPAWSHVERLLGGSRYHMCLGTNSPGDVTRI